MHVIAKVAPVKSNLQAILLMTFAMSAFALADLLIRMASTGGTGSASAGQMLALQGLIGFFFFSVLMRRRNQRITPELMKNPFVLARTLSDLVAATCFVTALTLMPVSDASAILQVQPLVVTMGAVLFLGERVGVYRWSAIFVGFIGVMIIIRPGTQGINNASILVLLSVLGLSARDLFTRKLPTHMSTLVIVCFVSATLIPVGFFLHVFTLPVSFFSIDMPVLVIAVISACSGMVGYYALTECMRIGEISAVAPYRYTRLISAFVFAWILLGEVPDTQTLIGSAIIVTAGISVIYREHYLSRS